MGRKLPKKKNNNNNKNNNLSKINKMKLKINF